MGAPLAVESWAHWHARELRRTRLRKSIFNILGAVLVSVLLTSEWWLK